MDSAALRDTSSSKSSNDDASESGRSRAGQRKKAAGKGGLRGSVTDTTTFLAISVPASGPNHVKIIATTVTKSDGTRSAKFSLYGDPLHAYEAGVVLIFEKPEQTAIIYWYLDKHIASLSSSNPLLQFAAASGGEQSLSTAADQYASISVPFLVNFVAGDIHDPQIIVTPIGNGPPPHMPEPVRKKGGKASANPAKGKASAKPAKAPAKAAKGKAPAKAAKSAPKRGGAAAKGKKR